MRKKTLSVIIFFLANLYVFAQATPQKYGYINSEYIFTKLTEYKDSKSKLDKLSDRWMKEIEDKNRVLTQKKDLYNREEVLLPSDEKERRLAELASLETDVIEFQKSKFGVSGEYFQKRQELVKPIQDKVFDAMQKIAIKKNYSFIFDKANQSNLLFADKKFDLSDDVIKEMGSK